MALRALFAQCPAEAGVGGLQLTYSLAGMPSILQVPVTAWELEYTDEFGAWWDALSEAEQDAIDRSVLLLIEHGPQLGYPYSSDVRGSRHPHLRELRVQHAGRPYRVLYAFDPRRTAILLLGGEKTGDPRWHQRMVPLADRLYDEHLEELRKEGLI